MDLLEQIKNAEQDCVDCAIDAGIVRLILADLEKLFLLAQGFNDGYDAGREDGYEDGFNDGYWEGQDDLMNADSGPESDD